MYQSAIIRDLVYYLDESEDVWIVHLTVHLETQRENTSEAVEGNLTVEVKELLVLPVNTTLSAIPDKNGEFSFNISFQLPKVSGNVRLLVARLLVISFSVVID